MKEIELKESMEMKLVQYECPGCKKKFYVNDDDIKELETDIVIDCPFCDIAGIPEVRNFEIEVKKIFEIDKE